MTDPPDAVLALEILGRIRTPHGQRIGKEEHKIASYGVRSRRV
jgi:hypothetical protein